MSKPYHVFPTQVNRTDQSQGRKKLIENLRSAAYLASWEAYNSPGLHQRCCLVRLVYGIDEVLRQLCNNPRHEAR
jgi:hypothetical protein